MKIGVLCYYNSDDQNTSILLQKTFNGRSLLGHLLDFVENLSLTGQVLLLNIGSKRNDALIKFCAREQIIYSNINKSNNSIKKFIYNSRKDYVALLSLESILFNLEEISRLMIISSSNRFDLVSGFLSKNKTEKSFLDIIKQDHISGLRVTETFFSDISNVISDLRINHSQEYYYELKQEKKDEGSDFSLINWEKIKSYLSFKFEYSYSHENKNYMGFLDWEKNDPPWKNKSHPFLIAEIGGNHEGDFEVAKKMAKLAIDSGVDCVKFQLYRGNSLVSASESPSRNKHFKRFELSKEQHIYLACLCKEAGLQYLASVWDLEMLDWIDDYLDFYKIGSGDFTAWPILSEFLKRGKPLLISTGLCDMNEVAQTIKWIRKQNPIYKDPNMICMLQCTSMYPIENNDANLNVMETFRKTFNLKVGYSDHTIGTEALKIATAKGASVLEFHFTDEREGKDFRDHKVSLLRDEVKHLKNEINEIIVLSGDNEKVPQPSEEESGHNISFRRGVYLNRRVSKGEKIKETDLVFLRPAHGIDARDFLDLVGSEALIDLEPFDPIKPEYLLNKDDIYDR